MRTMEQTVDTASLDRDDQTQETESELHSQSMMKAIAMTSRTLLEGDKERATLFPLQSLRDEVREIIHSQTPSRSKDKETIELQPTTPFFTTDEKSEREWRPSKSVPLLRPERNSIPLKSSLSSSKFGDSSRRLSDLSLIDDSVERATSIRRRSCSMPEKGTDDEKNPRANLQTGRFPIKCGDRNALIDIHSFIERNAANEKVELQPLDNKTSEKVQILVKRRSTNIIQKDSDTNRRQGTKSPRKSTFTKFDEMSAPKSEPVSTTNEQEKKQINEAKRSHCERIKEKNATLIELHSIKKIETPRNSDSNFKSPSEISSKTSSEKAGKCETSCNRKHCDLTPNQTNSQVKEKINRIKKNSEPKPQPLIFKKTIVTPFSFYKREEEFFQRKLMRSKMAENKKYEIKKWARPATDLKKKPFKIQPFVKVFTVPVNLKFQLDERQKEWKKYIKGFNRRQERLKREKQRKQEIELRNFRKKLIPKINELHYDVLGITPIKGPLVSPFRILREESLKICTPFQKLKSEENEKISIIDGDTQNIKTDTENKENNPEQNNDENKIFFESHNSNIQNITKKLFSSTDKEIVSIRNGRNITNRKVANSAKNEPVKMQPRKNEDSNEKKESKKTKDGNKNTGKNIKKNNTKNSPANVKNGNIFPQKKNSLRSASASRNNSSRTVSQTREGSSVVNDENDGLQDCRTNKNASRPASASRNSPRPTSETRKGSTMLKNEIDGSQDNYSSKNSLNSGSESRKNSLRPTSETRKGSTMLKNEIDGSQDNYSSKNSLNSGSESRKNSLRPTSETRKGSTMLKNEIDGSQDNYSSKNSLNSGPESRKNSSRPTSKTRKDSVIVKDEIDGLQQKIRALSSPGRLKKQIPA